MAFFASDRMPTITKGARLLNMDTEPKLFTPSGTWFTAPLTSPPPMLVVKTPSERLDAAQEEIVHERVRDFLSGKTPCLVLPAGYIVQRIN